MKNPRFRLVLAAIVVVVGVGASAATAVALTHDVTEGDSLSRIAESYDTTVEELVRLNDLSDADAIRVGQRLIVAETGDPGATAEPFVYTVEPGDSLSDIAARFGVDPSVLAADNAIADPDVIVAGTRLTVPVSAPGVPDPEPTTAHLERYYTVQPGDSLTSIAAWFGVTTEAVLAANDLADPDVIVTGERLRLPVEGGSDDEIRAVIVYWADYYGVPSDLLLALTYFESGWNNAVVSEVGAIGIGQLLPSTAEWIAADLIGAQLDPFVAEDNIRMSARFMSYLLDHLGGDERLAVAGYYQGLYAVSVHGIYESSLFYVDGILSLRQRI